MCQSNPFYYFSGIGIYTSKFLQISTLGESTSEALKIHIVCWGDRTSFLAEWSQAEKKTVGDRRKCSLMIMSLSFFLWVLKTPGYFVAFYITDFSFFHLNEVGFARFCHLKSKAPSWYNWDFTLLFRWFFTHGSKICDSRVKLGFKYIPCYLLAVLNLKTLYSFGLSSLS